MTGAGDLVYTVRDRDSKIYFQGPASIETIRGPVHIHNTGDINLWVHVGWDIQPAPKMIMIPPKFGTTVTVYDHHLCFGATEDIDKTAQDIPLNRMPLCGWTITFTHNNILTKIHNNRTPVYIITGIWKDFIVENTRTAEKWISPLLSIHSPSCENRQMTYKKSRSVC